MESILISLFFILFAFLIVMFFFKIAIDVENKVNLGSSRLEALIEVVHLSLFRR